MGICGEREREIERESEREKKSDGSRSELALLMPPPNGHSGGGVSLYVRENCWKGVKKNISNRKTRLGKPLPLVFVSFFLFVHFHFFFLFIYCKPILPQLHYHTPSNPLGIERLGFPRSHNSPRVKGRGWMCFCGVCVCRSPF